MAVTPEKESVLNSQGTEQGSQVKALSPSCAKYVQLWKEARLVFPLRGDVDLQQTHLQPALLARQVFVLFTVCELQQSWSSQAGTDTFGHNWDFSWRTMFLRPCC